MAERDPDADAVFRDILASYAGSPSMEQKRMFGSVALMVDGKMACFVNGRGSFVGKLPPERMTAIIEAGLGAPMEMRGRPMTGWLAVPLVEDPDPTADWWTLADEAVRYVHALTAD